MMEYYEFEHRGSGKIFYVIVHNGCIIAYRFREKTYNKSTAGRSLEYHSRNFIIRRVNEKYFKLRGIKPYNPDEGVYEK